jgi:hypothetical protein
MRLAADRNSMRRTIEPSRYFLMVDFKETDGQTLRLVHFNLPEMMRKARKGMLEKVMEEDKADALIEVISSKAGIVHKDQRRLYAILATYHSKQE